jgi:uncharacterized protein YbbC (DUF1343 family)/CubicO group peptidase (beta-lactamase class C family)
MGLLNFRLGFVLLATLFLVGCAKAGADSTSTESIDAPRMEEADGIIDAAIARKGIPGGVLLVERASKTVYLKAYGNRSVAPVVTPMTTDTIFDMASLSKPIGCATSVMILAERGKLKLSDPVAKYIPAFAANGKQRITIEDLLLHRGHLIPDNDIDDYKDGPAIAWEKIHALKPTKLPLRHFVYSDMGYIVLGKLVEVVDGRRLDVFAREEIFSPLKMERTAYLPPQQWKAMCAPTEQREGRWMVGEVHDPRAYALGGVAGHAGLFSTASDLQRYCRMILNGGDLEGKRILKKETVEEMTTVRCLPDGSGCRTYGFDVRTAYSSARGERFESLSTFGHTGFTGTMFWIDPKNDCFVIFLTNRVHPDGKGEIVQLRKRVVSAVGEALLGQLPAATARRQPTGPSADVWCGIDVLKADKFKMLENQRIALVTNHTGRDREGNRTVDLLTSAKNLKVVKLFSPEHGLYGVLDEKVADTTDPKTGLPVFSLYGATQRPSAAMLEGVDTIVYDIQDVGARFYTYLSTMGLCMEEAAKQKIRVVVLDRPNPITGLMVDGPIADKESLGFVAYAPFPLLNGMTVGEMARYFNAERGIGCDLTVVELRNWKRVMWWDETGLTWVNPSPNMRNPTQALLYTAVGTLEGSNISVGRGTDQPFEVFGAPWIDGRKLANALNGSEMPGLRFAPIEFTPESSKFKGQVCKGVYMIVTDRTIVEPAKASVIIAWNLRNLFGEAFEIGKISRLLANAETLKAIGEVDDPREIPAMWKGGLEEFKKVREKYLIYK